MTAPNAHVLLRAAGVALLLDITEGRLPAVAHWGADIDPTDPDIREVDLCGLPPHGVSPVEQPVRLSILPEHWTGWMGRPGLSGSRADGRAWSPRFFVHRIRIDGADVVASDEPVIIRTGPARIEVDASDPVAALNLAIEIELQDTGILRTRAAVTNSSTEPFRVDGLTTVLPVPRTAAELLDFAGRGTRERVPLRRPMQTGLHLRENRRGHTGHDSALVLHLGEPGFDFATREVWAVHVAWSGNHIHLAEQLSTGEQVIGGGELLLPGEIVLGERDSYRSPWLYASHGIGLDAVARRFHAHLRSRPNHPRTPRPITLNVWEAVYFQHDLAVMTGLADQAAALGVERFVLDDGWFSTRRDDRSGLGDWWVSTEVWPTGLGPLVDHVHALGMQFGLWFEPEMVNPDSAMAREHPEWILATGGRTPLESRHQQVLNLGDPACFSEVRRQLFAVLDDIPVDAIKWDHNRQLVDAGAFPSGRPGVHEQTLAVYRLMDEVRTRFPAIEIESCAGGGARVDLEVLERTDRVWVSDCIDPLERQSMHRWTTQLLPPELMGAHIASPTSHITGRRHDLSFRAATALFGHLGIEWDLRQATPAELEELGVWIAFHKAHRGVLHDGELVRIDHPDGSLMAHGVVARDRTVGLYSIASVARSSSGHVGRVRLPGLADDRRYRVRPVPVGWQPEATEAPPWWGLAHQRDYEHVSGSGSGPRWTSTRPTLGVETSGRLLGTIGLAVPGLAPEHAVVYLAEAVPDAG